MMRVPIDYMQTDPKWAGNPYRTKGENTTIKSSGCGTTCAAMVIASLADNKITPADTARWSMAHGYKAYHQGTFYSYFTPQMKAYGIKCAQVNYSSVYHGSSGAKAVNEKARKAVDSGAWMICAMGKGDWTRSGHFVLWYGNKDGYAYIRDPNSRKISRRKAPLSKFQFQVKYYFEVSVEEDDEMTQEQFDKMAEAWFSNRGYKEPAEWSKMARDWAYEKGVLTGGGYERPATREDLVQVMYNYDKMKK